VLRASKISVVKIKEAEISSSYIILICFYKELVKKMNNALSGIWSVNRARKNNELNDSLYKMTSF